MHWSSIIVRQCKTIKHNNIPYTVAAGLWLTGSYLWYKWFRNFAGSYDENLASARPTSHSWISCCTSAVLFSVGVMLYATFDAHNLSILCTIIRATGTVGAIGKETMPGLGRSRMYVTNYKYRPILTGHQYTALLISILYSSVKLPPNGSLSQLWWRYFGIFNQKEKRAAMPTSSKLLLVTSYFSTVAS